MHSWFYKHWTEMIQYFYFYYTKRFNFHCVKSVRIRSFSGPYFPAFGVNTERIQSEYAKKRTRKTPNTDNFQAVFTIFLPLVLSPISGIRGHSIIRLSPHVLVFCTNGTKYSRMDQVKFAEDGFQKIWKDMVCWGRPYHFRFSKGRLPQTSIGSFLNTLPQTFTIFKKVA